MSDRARILGDIRVALGRDRVDDASAGVLAERLEHPHPNRLPAATRGDRATLLQRFVDKLRRVDASVARVDDLGGVPAAVAAWLGDATTAVRVAPHPDLAALDWGAAGLAATYGAARADDSVGVSQALAGVAESGTLVLRSGPDAPTTLNFLPDRHVVVVPADAVVGAYETVWQQLRESPGGMPRTVNWITGPSRTADIEQTLQLGIHGPRHLHVLLVGG